MKKISLLFGLILVVAMLCNPAQPAPQPEPPRSTTEQQPEMSVAPREDQTVDVTPSPVTRSQAVPPVPELHPAEPDCTPPEINPMPEFASPSSLQVEQEKQTIPEPAGATSPKMGDRRVVNGQAETWFLGFGWVSDNNEPNVVFYAEDMYENGNKIGVMGDINKQVGMME